MMLKAIKKIHALKDGELIGTNVLAACANTTPNSMSRMVSVMPNQISLVFKGKRLYGNPKTIAAFKKQYEIQT